ncbi:hypothetical protein [Streptomyces pseudogriseolus]
MPAPDVIDVEGLVGIHLQDYAGQQPTFDYFEVEDATADADSG